MANVVTLTMAQNKALELRKQIAEGVDPVQAKRQARETKRAAQAEATTFKQVCDAWIETHRPGWKGNSMMRDVRHLLYVHGKPLADIAVSAITMDMVQSIITPLWNKAPMQARRALSLWERVLDFARVKGWRQGDNPARWRGLHQYNFPKRRAVDEKHYAAMPYEQIPDFIRMLRLRQNRPRQSKSVVLALEFIILTACRSGEARGMQWDEIDWGQKLWVIPAERMKAGKQHRVPLSDQAMLLLEQQRQSTNGRYVFPGRWLGLLGARAMHILLQSRMKTGVTAHGFRSSFRDWCGNETDFAREHVEACLAHQVGNEVERAYRRQDALAKRRVIMQAWAAYCETGVKPGVQPIETFSLSAIHSRNS
jgi:integrase